MTKKCSKCKIDKTLNDFVKNKTKKDGYSVNCKQCQYQLQRQWYANNPDNQKIRVKNNKQKISKWLHEYKKKLKCEKCNFSHPAALDFHHIYDKTREISGAHQQGWSKKRILEEIKKCVVLCANCHRIHHYEEKNK